MGVFHSFFLFLNFWLRNKKYYIKEITFSYLLA